MTDALLFMVMELADKGLLDVAQLRAYGEHENAEIRADIAGRDIPDDLLAQLLEDSHPLVRAAAVNNPATDFDTFKEAVLGDRLLPSYKKFMCGNVYALKELEVFQKLWSIRGFDDMLIPRVHWTLEEEKLDLIDGRIFAFIEATILNASNYARELYSSYYFAPWASSTVLDSLKDDKNRAVVNNLANNPLLLVSTQTYMTERYKTPSVRISIAQLTKDNVLLNKIYAGTKSKDIRAAVENNPAFIFP